MRVLCWAIVSGSTAGVAASGQTHVVTAICVATAVIAFLATIDAILHEWLG